MDRDFPPRTSLEEAELFEVPFKYVAEHVRPFRAEARSGDGPVSLGGSTSDRDLRCDGLSNHCPASSLHRLSRSTASSLGSIAKCYPIIASFVFARDDDYFFGVLALSRAHELWALRREHATGMAAMVEVVAGRHTTTRPASRPSPSRGHPATNPPTAPSWRPSEAARRLNELREGWLNPEGPLVGEERTEAGARSRTSTTSVPPGSTPPTAASTRPSSTPTAGPPTSATTRCSRASSPSTRSGRRRTDRTWVSGLSTNAYASQ